MKEDFDLVRSPFVLTPSRRRRSLRGAEGDSRTISIKNPQMQQRMSNLQVGDLVELTYSKALATRLMPKS
jgi:hypothetical protein